MSENSTFDLVMKVENNPPWTQKGSKYPEVGDAQDWGLGNRQTVTKTDFLKEERDCSYRVKDLLRHIFSTFSQVLIK